MELGLALDVAARAPIQRCGLRSSTFQFFAVSSTTVLVKGLLPVAAAIVSESAAAIAMRRSATRAREVWGTLTAGGIYSCRGGFTPHNNTSACPYMATNLSRESTNS